jgi:tetratricopeptide (TPR) repeat protein
LGLFDEGIKHGTQAQKIASFLVSDQYLFFKSLASLANTYICKGERNKVLEAGQMLLDYGKSHSNLRSMFLGYLFIGYSHFIAGDFPLAVEYSQKAVQISVDPLYSVAGKLLLGFSHAFRGNFHEIDKMAEQTWNFCQEVGCEVWGTMVELLVGVTYIANGQMSKGLKLIENVRGVHQKNKRKGALPLSEYILGKIYLQIVEGENLPSFSILARNIGFMLKNVPAAAKKSEDHFKKAIELSKEVGTYNYMAQAYFDLGILYKTKKRTKQAQDCISKALDLFEKGGSEVYLKQAQQALASLS